MLRIYMGAGVGKTTAAAGLCLRAAAHGKHVRVLQLLKPEVSPEFALLARQNPCVRVSAANPEIPFFYTLSEAEQQARISETHRAAEFFFRAQADDFLLVADEMGGALENGMLKSEMLLDWLSALPDTVHVVLTGRYFPESILKKADCISEIQCMRHPYDRGVQALAGLEF